MSLMGHSVVLCVVRCIAEKAHATETAHAHFVTNFGGGRLGGSFGSARAGIELGEETAHDRGTLSILPSGTHREHVNDMELQIPISSEASRHNGKRSQRTAELASLRSLIWMSSTCTI